LKENLKQILLQELTNNEKVGFLISGGFDSSLLLYICCLLKKELGLNTEFKIFTIPRHDDSKTHANRVIDFMSKYFDIKFDTHIVGDPDAHQNIVPSGIKEALKLVNLVLIGDNKNPDHMPGGPLRPKAVSKTILQPFYNYTKKDIIELAIKVDIIKEISAISHTCNASKTLKCTKCYPCRERAWAFAENNHIDIGTM